jgi:hypothetical protein
MATIGELPALLLTLSCEVPLVLVLAQRLPPAPAHTPVPRPRWHRVLPAAISASALSHPLAWRMAAVLAADEYAVGLILIELAVWLFEASWYALWLRPGTVRALQWSALANGASFALGFLLALRP